MTSPIQQIKTLQEFNALIDSPSLVVVDFSAAWCGPCQTMKPIFETMAENNPNVIFGVVDVDEAADVAEQQEISSLPTFRLFRNGKQIAETKGADYKQLHKLIEMHRKN